MKYSSTEKKNTAWITWEIQPRNRSMARLLGVPLHELISNSPRLIRYIKLSIKTISIISKGKVKVLFVQNPSIVLSLIAVILRPIFKLKVIVDAHNSGIFPAEQESNILNKIAKFICKHSDITIVTNKNLADIVSKRGGTAFVMPDPLPDYSSHSFKKFENSRPYLVFICTWASDEPYMEVIEAVRNFGDNIDILITGNFRKKLTIRDLEILPENIRLLGFIDEDEYLNCLAGSIAAIDLTTRDNCLVCGAYEAVSLEIPAILSDSQATKDLFSKGVILSKNNHTDIRRAISEVLTKHSSLRSEIKLLKSELINMSFNNAEKLTALTSL